MDKVIEYSEFKFFKTEFSFKNEKQSEEYFDNILLHSCRKYVDAMVAESHERMHIVFSWREMLLYSSIVFLALSLLTVLTFNTIIPTIITLILSIVTAITRYYLNIQFQDIGFGINFTKSLFEMNNYAVLEEIRQEELDKLKNKNID